MTQYFLSPSRRRLVTGLSVLTLGAGLCYSTGCAEDNAHYVEGSERVTTIGHIDVQDWEAAAANLTQDMLNSPSFGNSLPKAAHQPAVMAMSRIINNTTQYIDTDLLTKKIRVVLLNTGKVVTTTTFGANPEDSKAKQTGEANKFFNDEHTQAPDLPDYSLSGKIIQVNARAGDTRQSTFVFQLSLTENRSGNAIWEGEKQITKQGEHNSVGY